MTNCDVTGDDFLIAEIVLFDASKNRRQGINTETYDPRYTGYRIAKA